MAVSPLVNGRISEELICSASWIGWWECTKASKATTWLYLYPEPTVEGIKECDMLLHSPEILYVACCYEANKYGKGVLIILFTSKEPRTCSGMIGRYRLNRGLLLPKKPRHPQPDQIVRWMRGPFHDFEGAIKPFNQTFREMRQATYMMKCRESDISFKKCSESWIESFMEIVSLTEVEPETIMAKTPIISSVVASSSTILLPLMLPARSEEIFQLSGC
ncbi:hypothetical protein M1146_05270 [Patescibacteria group bacterium]|nr:hypothetical protein [Patescibacteria group bacterium]